MRERPRLEPGQEWVWDYPRPPRLERVERLVRVIAGGVEIARSQRALRILETSHPPVYYVPPQDVRMDLLRPVSGSSFCDFYGGWITSEIVGPFKGGAGTSFW